MLDWLFSLEAKRKRLLAKAPVGPLKDYLSVPFPSPSMAIKDVPILSLDFETTGLDVYKDQILSMGYVDVDSMEVKLSTCVDEVINTQGQLVENNVVIHQITDDDKEMGSTLAEATEHLLKAMQGRVLLVHFNRIEKNFLQKACKQLYGMAPVFPMIDTLMVAKTRLDKRQTAYDPSELRLMTLREQYDLPMHFAHNALNDAIATAELLFAEIYQCKQAEETPLKQLML